jgi:hypothetical protein
MTFAELLHDIIKYGDFKGGIDLEEAHKAIDSEYQTPETGPAPEVGIDASASGVSGVSGPEIPEPVVPTPETPATV